MPVNLFHAIKDGMAKPGDNVFLYGFGGVSNATASLLKLGQVELASEVDL